MDGSFEFANVSANPLYLLGIRGQQFQRRLPLLACVPQAAIGFVGTGAGRRAFQLLFMHQGMAPGTIQSTRRKLARTALAIAS